MHDVSFQSRLLAESATLFVFGSLDELNIAAFREALREATEDYTKPAVVDLNGVTFMPSIAIGTLLGAMARAPGTRVVVDDQRPAHQVLEVLGLYEYAVTGRSPDHNTV
jgi:anti-anti-sigma factor